jgi:excisionase family DNA binding protein
VDFKTEGTLREQEAEVSVSVLTEQHYNNQPLAALVSAIAAEVVKQMEPKLVGLTPNVIQPALLTVKQAGAYLGRSEQSVQHLIFEKQIPVVRSGRRVHIRRADLDRWIDSNTY